MRLSAMMSGDFFRDVAKLSIGTIGGRLITLAALPIATRLYTPEHFSLLAVYLAVVSTLGVAACLRLEIAIPIVDDDDVAANLLAVSLAALALVFGIAVVVVLTLPELITQWLGNPGIEAYLWLIPFGVILSGGYSAFQSWTTRARRFERLARTRVHQAAIGTGTILALGWAGVAPLGLLLGSILNIGAGGLNLAMQARRQDRQSFRAITFRGMQESLSQYRRYPIFSTPEAMFNVASLQLPILLIAAQGGAEVGYLMLAMQLMTAPMALLGQSISQVYASRASEAKREGRLSQLTMKIMVRLMLIGFAPLILAGVLAPIVFPWIFGADWARAGEIVAWLVPWIALQFVASPVSIVMFVLGHQRAMLAITFVGFLLRTGSVYMAIRFTNFGVEALAISSAVFYAICCAIFISISFLHERQYVKNIK
jgi:O-antigen/teichoic acid export membrane protein